MRRRILLALGFSLGLHLMLFALLSRLGREQGAPALRRALVVEVVERPEAAAPRPGTRKAEPGRPGGGTRAHVPALATPQAPPARTGQPDAPRAGPNLFPEGAFAVALPGQPEPEPPDAGPPAVVLAGRIQTWRLDNLAEQRVAIGVDSYFSTLAHALRDGLGRPPAPGSPRLGTASGGQKFLQAYLASLAPPGEPPDPEPARAERGPQPALHDLGGREDDLIRRLLGPMAPTQNSLINPFELFKQSQLPDAAVLRVVQDAEGHLVRSELLASSGDTSFDAWVKRAAALALAAMPKPPDHGAGLHPDGTRSDWAFFRQGDGVSVLLLRVY